jgi:hypothetical protein
MKRVGLAVLLAVPVSLSSAQVLARVDSPPHGGPALWLSAGFGGGRLADNAESLTDSHLAGTYSNGRGLLTVRYGGNCTECFSHNVDESTTSTAAMLGARTTMSPQAFLAGAVGIGWGHRTRTARDPRCNNCDTVTAGPTTAGLALDAGAHVNFRVIGFALDGFSFLGPRGVRFVVWSISLEAGWFGR